MRPGVDFLPVSCSHCCACAGPRAGPSPVPGRTTAEQPACRQLVPNGASRSGWDTLAFTRRDRPLKQSQAEPQGPLSLVGVCHRAPRPSFT